MEGLQLVGEQVAQGILEDNQAEELEACHMLPVVAGRRRTVVGVVAEEVGDPTCSASCVKRARHKFGGPGCRSRRI